MKKFLITLLGIVFLLPAIASASSYCVKFPSKGNSMWSKRDNNIGVRFKYSYEITNEKGTINGDATVSGDLLNYDIGYEYYDYGRSDYCVDTSQLATGLQWFVDNATKEAHGIAFPANSATTLKSVWLDVKWGADCPKISDDLLNSVTHVVKIHRRGGDHINPFGCKWW